MKEIRNISILWLISIILLILNSCTPSFSPALMKADKILSTDYEQGKVMLDSIYNAGNNMSTADMKYYQLLQIKATDKAYRPITNQKGRIDSLVSFFEGAGNDNLLAETYFYAGRINYEIGDKPTALKYFQKAKEVVGKDNYALQGDIYCQMANVYRYTLIYDKAIMCLYSAWKADSIINNSHNMLYDLIDLGEVYFCTSNYRLAKQFFKKGANMSVKIHDLFMIRQFHHKLALSYYKENNLDEAKYHLNKSGLYDKSQHNNSGLLSTAITIYRKLGLKDSVVKYQNLLLKNGDVFAKCYALENIMKTKIDSYNDSSISETFRLYNVYVDSTLEVRNAESVKKVEQEYNYDLKNKENEVLKKEIIIERIVVIMASLLLLTLSAYLRQRIKYSKQVQKNLEFKIEKYKELYKKEMAKNAMTLHAEKNKIESSNIYNYIKQEIIKGTFKLDTAHWEELHKLIQYVYVDFDKNLYSFLNATPQEFQICLLIKISISPTNIAHFLNVSKEAISASRRRMYFKAFHKVGSPADWDKIIYSI